MFENNQCSFLRRFLIKYEYSSRTTEIFIPQKPFILPTLGMLWISVPPELCCQGKDTQSMPNAASVKIQFSVVLEDLCFPSHTIYQIFVLHKLCLTSVPDNTVIEGERPFLNPFAWDLQRLHFCSWICHPFAACLTGLYCEAEGLVKTSILTVAKQVACSYSPLRW